MKTKQKGHQTWITWLAFSHIQNLLFLPEVMLRLVDSFHALYGQCYLVSSLTAPRSMTNLDLPTSICNPQKMLVSFSKIFHQTHSLHKLHGRETTEKQQFPQWHFCGEREPQPLQRPRGGEQQ